MNEKAIAKQVAHVADALAKGARLLTGGKRSTSARCFSSPPFWPMCPPMR